VNIEVISATKYISGGATAFGGAIIDHGNFEWNLNPHLIDYFKKFGKNAFISKLPSNQCY
jgi:O-acetylhomoserine (thiol)-lyase